MPLFRATKSSSRAASVHFPADETRLRSDNGYVLGYSDAEHRRLQVQARLLQPWTEHFLRAGGLREGMVVVDLGSGAGDVSMAAADIVGPTGRVIGVERDARSVERATERAAQAGYAGRVEFRTAALDWPVCAVWDDSYRLLTEVFRAGGAQPDFGRRLNRTFLDAGLPAPEVESVTPVGSGPDSMIVEWPAMSLLGDRLGAALAEPGSQVLGPAQYGAWSRKLVAP